ncbi:hypothetical protein LTR95_004260 [Oleoguttula sp. CCFEE 5521]
MEDKCERGRGLRRNRSRELLSKLLPGNKSRTTLNADVTRPDDAGKSSADTPNATCGRSRSTGNRLSALLHNVSTLDVGSMFTANDADAPAQPLKESCAPPVLVPIVVAGPSVEANIRLVEADHPAQWPGMKPEDTLQLVPIDAELMQEVRKRRSVLAEADGKGLSMAAMKAAINGRASSNAARIREAEPRSIAQVLRSDQPCNLAFTLQTELSIIQRKLAARETQCHNQAAHISGLQSTLAASYLATSETVAENRTLKEEIKRLERSIEELEMAAGATREDSKIEMHEAVAAGVPSTSATAAESVKDGAAVDVAWTFGHHTQCRNRAAVKEQDIEEVAPDERPTDTTSNETKATAVKRSRSEPSTGKHATVAADVARIQARAVVPNSNEDAAIELWAQEELKLAIVGLMFAADGGHPAIRL